MSDITQSGAMPHAPWLCTDQRWAVGTPEQFRWLYGLLQVVLILNLIDAVLTLFWVGTGLAREANVLLQTLVNEYPMIFVITKMALVSLGAWLLWHRRYHPLSVIGLVAVFVVYYDLQASLSPFFCFSPRCVALEPTPCPFAVAIVNGEHRCEQALAPAHASLRYPH